MTNVAANTHTQATIASPQMSIDKPRGTDRKVDMLDLSIMIMVETLGLNDETVRTETYVMKVKTANIEKMQKVLKEMDTTPAYVGNNDVSLAIYKNLVQAAQSAQTNMTTDIDLKQKELQSTTVSVQAKIQLQATIANQISQTLSTENATYKAITEIK